MNTSVIACRDAAQLARSLRIWRMLRRIKQHHAGELLGVSQATISRWENGNLAPTPDEQTAIRELLHARLDSAADRELARMVDESTRAVHLVCDLTHRLLALSAQRERQCSIPRNDLIGRSLWRYASPEIVAAESTLADVGWFEAAPPAVEIRTGANTSTEVRILKSRMRWVRFRLSDGSYARLVETIALEPSADPPEQVGEAA
ncbi:helix-turn-helix transcriptional regulator [Tahibacter soli]|jgi:transcriptional regulator with XRE-family HTH domain|uniref:Helix-turn-helix transcriptional regulator n=1 Tax=Tahibacter soli TaxID=2983605 RepID=A0A9X4BHC4_9GAMM|nr:helix-turn-helix transcriptional regulator [Tahibacter soli]MDC8012671.1 helix-turn-helix transcriptional regulator [Tahibacter soli]